MPRTKKSPVDFVGRPVWAEVSLTALRQNLEAIRALRESTVGETRRRRARFSASSKATVTDTAARTCPRPSRNSAPIGLALLLPAKASSCARPECANQFWCWADSGPAKKRISSRTILLPQFIAASIWRCSMLPRRKPASGTWPIHLKIDTGMNRLGISPGDMDCFANQLAKCQAPGTQRHLHASGFVGSFDRYAHRPSDRGTVAAVSRGDRSPACAGRCTGNRSHCQQRRHSSASGNLGRHGASRSASLRVSSRLRPDGKAFRV